MPRGQSCRYRIARSHVTFVLTNTELSMPKVDSDLISPPASDSPPITHGNLLDFPRDPLLCMRRLYQTHGDIAALEEDGQRLVFAFGPKLCQQVLSDAKTFHSRFFAIRG